MTRLIPLAGLLVFAACAGRDRMEHVRRITAAEAHTRLEAKRAILVCAYDAKACQGTHLVGAITLEELQSQLSSLPSQQEIILFCG